MRLKLFLRTFVLAAAARAIRRRAGVRRMFSPISRRQISQKSPLDGSAFPDSAAGQSCLRACFQFAAQLLRLGPSRLLGGRVSSQSGDAMRGGIWRAPCDRRPMG